MRSPRLALRVSALVIAACFAAPALAQHSCPGALLSKAETHKEFGELAEYFVSISRMQDSKQKTVELDAFKKRLSQLSALLGHSAFPEVNRLAQERLGKLTSEDTIRDQRDTDTRRQLNMLQPFREIDRIAINHPLHTLDASYFTNRRLGNSTDEITGSGVQWTADDRYFAFRTMPSERTKIYDTQKRALLDWEPKSGLLSSKGHFYLENVADKVTITDLDTGSKFGPFAGLYNNRLFDDNLVITETPGQSHPQVNLYNFKTGQHWKMGTFYGLTSDRTIAARRKSKGTFEIFELKSGRILSEVQGDSAMLGLREDGIMLRQGRRAIFVRLRDQKIVDIPQGPWGVSRDANTLIFKVTNPTATQKNLREGLQVLSVDTAKTQTFWGYNEVQLSPDRSQAIFYRSFRNETIWIDLDTLSSKPLAEQYRQFSPNGRFIYHARISEHPSHVIHDLKTDRSVSFDAEYDFDFAGSSDFFFVLSKDGKQAYLNDGNFLDLAPYAVRIGETGARSSASGRYVLTYGESSQDKLHLRLLELDRAPPAP